MSDVEFNHGDIAWVKLGYCWWPGEVVAFDQLPESIQEDLQNSSKAKLPLAIVKFFQEDTYEYVKKNDKIFPYNCERKDEFIRKGLEMHRAKKVSMEKFPEDVTTAEKRSGGDEAIVKDPKYSTPLSGKKMGLYTEIFGSAKIKNSTPKPRGKPSQKTSLLKQPPYYVTHPRFTGVKNDHQRKILLQQPIKQHDDLKENKYKCNKCDFVCTRLNVIVLHDRTHNKNDPYFKDKRKKKRMRRPKIKHNIPTSTTNSIDEDLALLEQGLLLSDATLTDLESVATPTAPEKKGKKKRKRASAPQQLGEVVSNKKPAPNIRNDLLAEWEDIDENDDDADETDMEKSVDSEENANMETSALVASPAPKQDGGESKELNALLEVTKVPELPALPSNASGGKTPEVATKLTNPKKRFVKSFEDFELSMKEREKEELEKKQDTSDKKMLSGDDDSSNDEPVEERRTRRSTTKLEDEKPVVVNENQPSELRKSTRRSAAPSLVKDHELSSSDEKKETDKKVPTKKEEVKKPITKKVDEKKIEKVEEADSDESKSGGKKDLKQKEPKKDVKDGKESPDESKTLVKDAKDIKVLDAEKKKADKEKPKPKEPILTEIDVFGSLRAQENEKYKKKSEDSPRRETRASRSKSRSESSHEKEKKDDKEPKKGPAKSAPKEDTEDEPPINNGSEKDNVPLISKIKSKLLNVLANEGKDSKSTSSPKSRRRAHESDLVKDDKDSKKSKLDESEPEAEDKMETEPDTARRHSLRTSASVKPNEMEKKIPTKAEVKSPAPIATSKLLSPAGRSGPKTYLRATRATNASPTPPTKVDTQKDVKKSSESGATESDEDISNDTMKEAQTEQVHNKQAEKVEDVDNNMSPTNSKRRQLAKKSSDAAETANLSESSEHSSEDDKVCPVPQSKREIAKKTRDLRTQNIDKNESEISDSPVDPVKSASPEASVKKDDTTPVESGLELKETTTETPEVNDPKTTIKADAPLSPPERRRTLPRASRMKNVEKEQNLALERKKSTDKIDTAAKTTNETKAESTIELKPAPGSPTKSKQALARSPSPVKSPARLRSPASQEKEKDEVPKSPAKLPQPLKSPPTNLLKSPSPQTRLKSPSPVKTVTPLKSPPLILNKDAPKIESPKKSLPNKIAIESGSTTPAVIKSPQKVSLNSQELSIEKTVDKFEVTFNNKGTSEPLETDELEKILGKEHEIGAAKDKDVSTVTVAKDVLSKGQIEFAKDEQEGSELLATTIPTVEEKLPDIVTAEDEHQVEKRVVKLIGNTADTAATASKSEPIILNSRMTSEQESTSKLLEVLMGSKATSTTTSTATQQQVTLPKVANPKFEVDTKKQAIVTTTPKGGRILTTAGASASKSKPTILSNTIIKRADTVVAVKKASQTYDDIENIDTFIIKKPAAEEEQKKTKTKILEHTIITPGGQLLSQPVGKPKKIIQQEVNLPGSSTKTVEEKVYDLLKNSDEDTFDINNMPIVLSDQPLLAEGESVMVGQALKKATPQQSQLKTVPKQATVLQGNRQATPTTRTFTKVVKGQRVYQTGSGTLLKQNPTIVSQSGKPGQYVIVPSVSSSPAGSKYTVGKRQQQHQVVKKQIVTTAKPTVQSAPEASGNKIMIVTNPQGHRSRVVLSPEQASRMGYQTQTTKKIIKTTPTMLGKDRKLVTTATTAASSPTTIKKPTKVETVKQQPLKKFSLQGTLPPMKAGPGQTRTVIIKDQQGNIVNRIHGFSDEDIEKQINEQLEAINRAANVKVKSTTVKRVVRKVATTETAATPTKPTNVVVQKTPIARSASTTNVPPLAPISPVRKVESTPQKQLVRQKMVSTTVQKTTPAASATIVQPTVAAKEKQKEERQPKQMVIQDSLGNETTITEGQILALPSETVDGQPQSYMLVTLDESGNLTPLNNEALMSLDPNLNLGGDLSNMVLQIEGGNSSEAAAVSESPVKPAVQTSSVPTPAVVASANVADNNTKIAPLGTVQTTAATSAVQPETEIAAALQDEVPEQMQAVACSINKGDIQQQLIITGDPVAAQKFLESLRDGNQEIAQLLAQAEGNNIFIHTDGQQILINTDADSQIQLLNPDGEAFAAQTAATKNQDILAAALADTDVFQADAKVTAAQLSPGYPLAANNVLETSTVNSPIMTPLEVPSAPTKRTNKSDVLNQLPTGVDLPITVTDPHIAQTVSNQQVSMIGTDLSTSIDLSLSMQDVATSSTTSSTEMSSPNSFAYSLAASLDDAEKFSSPISMPLLTEDPDPEVPVPTPSTSSSSSSPKVMGDTKTDTSATTSVSESTTMSKGPREYMLANDIMSNRLMSSLSVPPLPDIFEAYDNAEVDTPPATVSETTSTSASSSPTGNKRPLEETPDILDAGDETDNKRAKLD